MQQVLMAAFFSMVLALFCLVTPTLSLAIEVAPRISDREIVERLTRLEEGQKALNQRITDLQQTMDQRITDTNQRITDMNQRITDLQQTMDQRFADLNQTLLGLFGALIALIIALFGYIAWDRRTMFRPIKERLERIEQELEIKPDRPPRSSTPRARRPADSAPPDSAAHGAARA